jgi:hypothetical protein
MINHRCEGAFAYRAQKVPSMMQSSVFPRSGFCDAAVDVSRRFIAQSGLTGKDLHSFIQQII